MSLTIDFHAKLSGHEAKEWIRNCLTAMGHEHDDEEKLIEFISQHKPKDFKAPARAGRTRSPLPSGLKLSMSVNSVMPGSGTTVSAHSALVRRRTVSGSVPFTVRKPPRTMVSFATVLSPKTARLTLTVMNHSSCSLGTMWNFLRRRPRSHRAARALASVATAVSAVTTKRPALTLKLLR